MNCESSSSSSQLPPPLPSSVYTPSSLYRVIPCLHLCYKPSIRLRLLSPISNCAASWRQSIFQSLQLRHVIRTLHTRSPISIGQHSGLVGLTNCLGVTQFSPFYLSLSISGYVPQNGARIMTKRLKHPIPLTREKFQTKSPPFSLYNPPLCRLDVSFLLTHYYYYKIFCSMRNL